MTHDRYAALFARLEAAGEGGFIPFLTLGDPDPTTSAALIDAVVDAGADALELGLPFSDPVADGPIIQGAAARALTAGTTLTTCWHLVSRVRDRHPTLPIGLLGYANPIVRRGFDRFYGEAAAAGADSVLVADVPQAEARPFARAAEAAGVAPISIVPPNATPERLASIARASRGYCYVTARAGVTGDARPETDALATRIEALRRLGAPPAVVGFGIGTPTQVRVALGTGAAGVIAGSALVRRIEADPGRLEPVRRAIAELVRTLKEATRPLTPLRS